MRLENNPNGFDPLRERGRLSSLSPRQLLKDEELSSKKEKKPKHRTDEVDDSMRTSLGRDCPQMALLARGAFFLTFPPERLPFRS